MATSTDIPEAALRLVSDAIDRDLLKSILGHSTYTTISPPLEPPSLTLDTVNKMIASIRHPIARDGLFGMRVEISPFLPDEVLDEEWTETVQFPAHQAVQWLSRFVKIEPYTEMQVVRRRMKPAPYYVMGDKIICTPKQADQLSKASGKSDK